jgi:hypothetical protein
MLSVYKAKLNVHKLEWTGLSMPLARNHLPLALLPELFPQSEALDDCAITLQILVFQIVQKPPALADEFQKTSARMVILFMLLEMIGQVSNASAKQGHLNFRRTRIGRVQLEFIDNAFSFFYI